MPTETLIERAYTLIHRDRVEEARPVLAELFKANQNDAEAWALAAEIAPTEATREEALRKVADLSADNRLTEWAINELSRLKGLTSGGARKEPPLPSVPDSWGGASSASLDSWSRQAVSTPHREAVPLPAIPDEPPPRRAESAPPEKPAAPEPARPVILSKPLPGERASDSDSMGYLIRALGGGIMILGAIVFVGAVISEPFNHLISGFLMGWVAIGLAVIGGLVTAAGYLMKD